jgi:hypothetical protein
MSAAARLAGTRALSWLALSRVCGPAFLNRYRSFEASAQLARPRWTPCDELFERDGLALADQLANLACNRCFPIRITRLFAVTWRALQ